MLEQEEASPEKIEKKKTLKLKFPQPRLVLKTEFNPLCIV